MKIKAQGDQKVEKVTVGFPEEVYRQVVLHRDLLGGAKSGENEDPLLPSA
jgi:hypothetical protein